MRLGVLDVGSNTIHLQVMDAHPGARPTPATNFKVELRLTDYLDSEGAISAEGVDLLHIAIRDSVAHAQANSTDEILAFATSAIRDATNGSQIILEINKQHELDLQILTGNQEAHMTFLAVRRWLGWSAGKLLVLDIGGGSLEIALGVDENPDSTISLALGAARLTRNYLSGDPYTGKTIKAMQKFVEKTINDNLVTEIQNHEADRFVATSKTFRTLARLGSHFFEDNPKTLKTSTLKLVVPRLIEMNNKSRSDLPGVSSSRSQQITAGAVVALSTLEYLKIKEVEICPWALREGVVLRRLDWLTD